MKQKDWEELVKKYGEKAFDHIEKDEKIKFGCIYKVDDWCVSAFRASGKCVNYHCDYCKVQ
jgi:hypothetical protein